MKKAENSSLKIAAAYIGTVVGAGFATGQEILQFFSAFGANGFLGILLTTLLLILFGVVIMELGYTLRARSHLEIIRQAGGKLFQAFMDIVITFFLFGSMTAMLAGTGALFSQQFGLPAMLGSLIMAVLTAVTVMTGIKGVINAISAVVPFLLVSVIGVSVLSILQSPASGPAASGAAGNGLLSNWLMAAVLYTSYNTVVSIAVLGPLGATAHSKKTVVMGGVLGGLGLGIASAMIYLALRGNIAHIGNAEVPMASIAGGISPMVQMLYSVVLVAEIYTTAVGSLYGFTARIADMDRFPIKGKAAVLLTAAAAFFSSMLGFSSLVKYLYPIVGYAGIALLLSLLYGWCRSKRHPGVILISFKSKNK